LIRVTLDTFMMKLNDDDYIYGTWYFLLEGVLFGFLELVELWKGLVVLSCLASSVEVYGIHDPVADG
jgi:hypothetical protein